MAACCVLCKVCTLRLKNYFFPHNLEAMGHHFGSCRGREVAGLGGGGGRCRRLGKLTVTAFPSHHARLVYSRWCTIAQLSSLYRKSVGRPYTHPTILPNHTPSPPSSSPSPHPCFFLNVIARAFLYAQTYPFPKRSHVGAFLPPCASDQPVLGPASGFTCTLCYRTTS